MKKIILPLIMIALTAVFFTGCEKDKIETAPLGPVNITPSEAIYTGGRDLYFEVYSDDTTYPATYLIRYDANSEGGSITVKLFDIEKRDYSGYDIINGPARANVYVGTLSAGEYDLTVMVGDRENHGKITVNENMYVLSIDQPNGITFNYDTLMRVPDGALWGFVDYTNPSADQYADAFRDSLANMGTTPLNLGPGYYGYFQVNDTGLIVQPIPDNVDYYRQFFREYHGDMPKLNSVVNYFETNFRMLKIQIYWVNNSPPALFPAKPWEIQEQATVPYYQ